MTETLVNRADRDTPPAADAAFARWLAGLAGDLLMNLRAEKGHADSKALRKAGDAKSHELIVGELARWRPSDAVLSEEGADDPVRLDADRVWIVDPLDGTREFGEEGRIDWAVHIALWQCLSGTAKLTAGAVALPAQHRVLATDKGPAYPPPPSAPGRGRLEPPDRAGRRSVVPLFGAHLQRPPHPLRPPVRHASRG